MRETSFDITVVAVRFWNAPRVKLGERRMRGVVLDMMVEVRKRAPTGGAPTAD